MEASSEAALEAVDVASCLHHLDMAGSHAPPVHLTHTAGV